jgi:hypothetical protein
MTTEDYSVQSWCKRRGICVATFYNRLKHGEMPKIIKIGAAHDYYGRGRCGMEASHGSCCYWTADPGRGTTMKCQLKLVGRQEMAPDNTSARSVELNERSEHHMPSPLGEELERVAERVRESLHQMNSSHTEIGRELRTVKKRLTRGQFLSWVSSACGLSQRTARSMMRAAEQALLEPCSPQVKRGRKRSSLVVPWASMKTSARTATGNLADAQGRARREVEAAGADRGARGARQELSS